MNRIDRDMMRFASSPASYGTFTRGVCCWTTGTCTMCLASHDGGTIDCHEMIKVGRLFPASLQYGFVAESGSIRMISHCAGIVHPSDAIKIKKY